VNQKDLKQMAEERIKDAKALIDGNRWEFAYYAAGYAVECALKSCLLARMIYTGWVFDENVTKVDACRTHDFLELIRIAGLRDELNNALKASSAAGGEFAKNWDTVNKWKVSSRYEPKTEAEAQGLYAAITDDPHGVLKWIQNFW
jgi:HEPN domain